MVANVMIRTLTRQYGRGELTHDELWLMIEKVLNQETAKAKAKALQIGPQPVEDTFDDSMDEALIRTQESIRRLQALHT